MSVLVKVPLTRSPALHFTNIITRQHMHSSKRHATTVVIAARLS